MIIKKLRKIVGLAFLIGMLSTAHRHAGAQSQVKPEVRRAEVRVEFKSEPVREYYISAPLKVPIDAPEPFLAVGASWLGTGINLSLRGSIDGRNWTEWKSFEIDDDSNTLRGETVGGLALLDSQTKFIQYEVKRRGAGEADLKSLRLSFISPGKTPTAMQEEIQERAAMKIEPEEQMQSTNYPKPTVITRTEWGCPDGQVTTHGTLSYTTVTHLIVHHTVNDNNATDWPAIVRSIWNLHIFTNGWADIGYNHLIDPNGVIYEGRAGGDNVIGAHFSGVNGGTMGVSMLGTFTDVTPTPKAMDSLRKILGWKCDQRNLDPIGEALHAASGLNLKNISGHRDGPGSTECPGNALYPLLPALRTEVKNILANVGALSVVSAASFVAGPLAGESIVAAFGSNLAITTQVATTPTLPLSLGGSAITVRDSAGVEKQAPLFFVSPGQVNFFLPQGLAGGPATVTAISADASASIGSVNLAGVAPALFSANSNGQGVAAAVVLRVKADNSQVFEPVAVFNQAQNRYVTTPIDLGPASDQVFLILYGTGFRSRTALSNVGVKVGGTDTSVGFAGAAPGFIGLDQCNARLPRTLAGRGEIDVVLTVDGKTANLVKVNFK